MLDDFVPCRLTVPVKPEPCSSYVGGVSITVELLVEILQDGDTTKPDAPECPAISAVNAQPQFGGCAH